jgi:L-ascorbate metabolism protein UlaG (beta-lactamase superfamily)
MSEPNTARITWLGHATVLIQTARGTSILIDPFIGSNPSFPKGYELPAKIDAILLTHAHFDHVSDALSVAARTGATIVAIHELAGYMASKGAAKTIGMNLGGSVALGDVTATMVEAKHSSSIQDEQGVHYGGIAAGFVLSIEGGVVLYHAGDTAVFGDMKIIGELYQPQVAMMPIGGHYTMGPKEASLAVRLLNPSTVLPLHFGTFPPLKGTPAELVALIDTGVEVVAWKPGESVEF